MIIPVYNEEQAVQKAVCGLRDFLKLNFASGQYEIIVVDDGSTDGTGEILKKIEGIKAVRHPYNKGYGAAVKTGARYSLNEWLVMYDSDGQHNPKYLPALLAKTGEYDMVIGQRQEYQGPFSRKPGKRIIRMVAEYLVEQNIPDINSGFRAIKKNYFGQFVHLLPNGFSLSTTITMAFLKAGLNVGYIPITVDKRVGASAVRQIKHGSQAILLILRIIMLFNPLKIFFPTSAVIGVLAMASFVYDLFLFDISSTTTIFFITAVMVFCFGLLADQISSIRRGDSH